MPFWNTYSVDPENPGVEYPVPGPAIADITEAELAGANSGYRADLASFKGKAYRVMPGGAVYVSDGTSLVPATPRAAGGGGGGAVLTAPATTSINLAAPGIVQYLPYTVTGAVTVTVAGNGTGAMAEQTFIADGVNVPSIVGAVKHGNSGGYLNTAGVRNYLSLKHDGDQRMYVWSQLDAPLAGAPSPSPAPTPAPTPAPAPTPTPSPPPPAPAPAPVAQAVTLTSQSANLTGPVSEVYSGTGTTSDPAVGQVALKLPAGVSGWIEGQHPNTTDASFSLAFDLASGLTPIASNDWIAACATNGSFQSGENSVTSAITPAYTLTGTSTSRMRLYRDGSTGLITQESTTDDGVTWIVRKTFSVTSTADLYATVHTVGTRKLYQPRVVGFA